MIRPMRAARRPARTVALVIGMATAVVAGLVVSTGAAVAAPVRYEAENATLFQCVVESNHLNFSGTGFVNCDNVTGSYVQWTVNAPAAGTATLGIRFANGTTTDRPTDIAVNGTLVSGGLSFPGTGNWDTWQTKTVTAQVNAGANTIRATGATVNGPPNLDFLDFEVASPFTDYQAENATIVQGTVATNHLGFTGTGFVDYTNVAGSYVEFSVTPAAAGPVSLAFRYANGTTTNRPMDITVNGNSIANDLAFNPTANWDTWAEATINAQLGAGANLIRATATTANGGPNLDRLRVSIPTDTVRPTTPGQPTCPDTEITTNSVHLHWGASTDNVGVLAYDIYHDGNKISEAAGTQTDKDLTGLTPNTQYRLSVFARDAAGNVSDPSAQAFCTTKPSDDTVPPTAPTNLTFSNVTSSSVNLSWGASTDNVGVTAYDARTAAAVYGTVTGNPPATSTQVTGLACGSVFTLFVVARDAGGNVSAPSNSVTFTTLGCTGGVPNNITTISTGWTIPWGTSFAPNGQTALVTERDSFRVFRVNRSGSGKTLIGTVPNSQTTGGEGGLMGVAFSPTWNGTTDRDVFFMHTSTDNNRIVKMTYDGSSLSGYTVLVNGIRKSLFHNGGRIAFGPDGFLYATTGDSQQSDLAQNLSSLNGKILRVTKTGAAAPGNPFGTRIYSYGHRNPQGIAWDSQGRLWEAEFGNSSADELNLIKPGLNYGWPICEGTCSVSGMENPKRTWSVSVASPSGIAIVRDVVYMAALRGERLWRIPLLSGESTGTPSAFYVGSFGRLRTVTKVPGIDDVWLNTTNCDNNGGAADGSDRIFRVEIR
jgi:glucose/arabinose dehydrogenase